MRSASNPPRGRRSLPVLISFPLSASLHHSCTGRVIYVCYAKLLTGYEERVKRHGREAAGPAPYLQEDESLFADHEDRLLDDVERFPFRPYRSRAPASGGGGRTAADAPPPPGVVTETAFWMGPTNARTGIHWDSVDAILHQVLGTKTLTLWPPSARSDLYVASKYNHGAELSLVDAAAPNLTRFPRFAHAPSLRVLLPAGSALYLPAGWWHAVTSLDATISVALRSQGACERRAALVDDAMQWLHNAGLYKVGDCVCHRAPPRPAAHGGAAAAHPHAEADEDDDGLGAAVEAMLRGAGVDLSAALGALDEEEDG